MQAVLKDPQPPFWNDLLRLHTSRDPSKQLVGANKNRPRESGNAVF
jgi:hypothetical protein